MKLINYILNNKLSIWWFARRATIIWFILSLAWVWVLYFVANEFITPENITKSIQSKTFQNWLKELSFLETGEYISIYPDEGLVTNKTGVIFSDSKSLIEINPEINCEDRFSTNYQNGLALSKNSLCARSNTKQQIFTYRQLLSWIADLELTWEILWKMIWLQNTLSWWAIQFTPETISLLQNDINNLWNNQEFLTKIVEVVLMIKNYMLIPAIIWWFFFAIWFGVYQTISFILYSILVLFIASIMKKKDIDFNKAFSIVWLPLVVIKLLSRFLWFWFLITSLLVIIIIWGIFYFTQKQEKSLVDSQSTENE